MKLILIRPMVFVKEREIIRVVLKENFVIVKNNCPVDGKTKREETKKFLNQMEKKSHHIKSRIFGALRRTGLNGWEFKK